MSVLFNDILIVMALSVINSSSPVTKLSVQAPTLQPKVNVVAPPIQNSLVPSLPKAQPVVQVTSSRQQPTIQQSWNIRTKSTGEPEAYLSEGTQQTNNNLPLQGLSAYSQPQDNTQEWLHSFPGYVPSQVTQGPNPLAYLFDTYSDVRQEGASLPPPYIFRSIEGYYKQRHDAETKLPIYNYPYLNPR